MTSSLSDVQLDALRELANIASGTAATALSQMLAQFGLREGGIACFVDDGRRRAKRRECGHQIQ